MKKAIYRQFINAGLLFFLLLFSNGLMNYGISLELLKQTNSSLIFGMGLVTGPLIGLLIAPIISKYVDRYS